MDAPTSALLAPLRDDSQYTIASQLQHPANLARFAAWSAQSVLQDCYQVGIDPLTRFTDEQVRRRAAKDVAFDLAQEAEMFATTYSAQQAADYRARYLAAYLRAWRDRAWHRAYRQAHPPNCIVCVR